MSVMKIKGQCLFVVLITSVAVTCQAALPGMASYLGRNSEDWLCSSPKARNSRRKDRKGQERVRFNRLFGRVEARQHAVPLGNCLADDGFCGPDPRR